MNQFHAMTADAVAEQLGVSLSEHSQGLTTEQVRERQQEFGRNELPMSEPPSAWAVAARQFKSPMIAFLVVCALITAVEREWVDTGAIVLILAMNAVVGFWQERKAERDVRALQSMTTTAARVRRAGRLRRLMLSS